MKSQNVINNHVAVIYIIQQHNNIYFASSNLQAAYRFLADNINPMDRDLLYGYKTFTLRFKEADSHIIPSRCGQQFCFKKIQLFSKYNSVNSTRKLLKTA